MAQFKILTKVSDGRKIGINIDLISFIEDLEDSTILIFNDEEVEESIDDIFPNSDTPIRQRDKATPFIPIKLSSN